LEMGSPLASPEGLVPEGGGAGGTAPGAKRSAGVGTGLSPVGGVLPPELDPEPGVALGLGWGMGS
jgi:hypothetical protein